jgi:hypothetical protein
MPGIEIGFVPLAHLDIVRRCSQALRRILGQGIREMPGHHLLQGTAIQVREVAPGSPPHQGQMSRLEIDSPGG